LEETCGTWTKVGGRQLNPKEHMTNSELLANIPECLRTPPLWVRYDLVKDAKKPDKKPSPRPVMKWADPEDRKMNLRPLDYLIENPKRCAGFQRFIDKDEGFVFIDLDGVRNPDTGEVKTWAVEVIETLNSYTEVSKSGKGIHIVCRGTLDEDRSRPPIEIYSGNAKKLMAMTGELYDLLKMTIESRQAEVEQLLNRINNKPVVEALNVMTDTESTKIAHEDLPESCIYGWLGQICNERMGAFPRAYAWLALLAGASVLVPRETKFRCNLYVDLDGPVHSGKSSAFDMAFHLLSLGEPSLMKMKSGSAEGLAEYVGDVDGSGRLLYPDELAHLLEKTMIESASFARFLTSAFYDDRQNMTVAKRKHLVFNARLSLAGGTVDSQFGDLFGSATTGGLYDRFLFGKCPTGYQYLWRPFDDIQPAYVPSTTDDGSFASADSPTAVCVQPSVFKERDHWIKELGITPRVAELCLRTATICASFDRQRTLKSDMLGPALELAKYQMRVRALLQPNPGENPDARMSFAVRNWLAIHAKDGQWIGRRLLFKQVSGHRLGPGVFDRALRAMEFNGELESTKVGKMIVVRVVPEPSASKNPLAVAGTSLQIQSSASTSHAEEATAF
jgi:hypothetical protein